MRIWFSIWLDQSINQKITIAWRFRWPKIPTIRKISSSIFTFFGDALVYPIPNATTLKLRLFSNQLPIISHSTQTVSHGMHVFTHDEGLIVLFLYIILQPFYACVHGCINIHMISIPCPFVMYWPRRITFMNPFGCSDKVYTIASFISHRP